jgi:hypothetical protein
MVNLDRATQAFGRGYRDCRDRRPKLYESDGTFVGYDYSEGWDARYNEEYWDAVNENKNRK